MEFELNHILSLRRTTAFSSPSLKYKRFEPFCSQTSMGEEDDPEVSSPSKLLTNPAFVASTLSVSSGASTSPAHLSSCTSETAIFVPDQEGGTQTADSQQVRKRLTNTNDGNGRKGRTLGFRSINDSKIPRSVEGSQESSNTSSSYSNSDSHGSLDFRFFKRFLRLHYVLFKRLSGSGGSAGPRGGGTICSWLFLFLVILCLLNEYIIYHVGLIPSKYYKILADQDLDGFWRQTAIASGIVISVSFVKSTKQFVQKLLTAGWRQMLTKTIHHEYFTNLHYFKLNILDHVIDNPDQRITQDVDKFTSTYCDILPKFILAPFLIGYYSYEAFTKAGWQGPAACFGFFVVGAVMNRLLMGPVIKYVIKQEKFEGNFRFIHMLVRIHSESIAFSNASELELTKANSSFDLLIKTQYKLYLKQYFLNISINLFDYFGSILSYLLLGIPIFTGVYNDLNPGDLSSVISQNSFVTMYLIFQFTSLVDTSVQFADVTGVSHRIGELIERLQLLDSFWNEIFKDDNQKRRNSETLLDLNYFKRALSIDAGTVPATLIPAWDLKNVSFTSPFSDKLILKDLTISINLNESLLIIGASNSGKSSLFRILRGLWPISTGTITKHFSQCLLLDPQFIFYSPQKLYLTAGSLREQLRFPCRSLSSHFQTKADESDWIKSYLVKLDLSHLLDRFGDSLDEQVDRNFYESLSPGEVQRLCILRIFYHRPLIALLDEATSALPITMEEIIYEECKRLKITTISIGHRDSLRQFHSKTLSLIGTDGKWEIS